MFGRVGVCLGVLVYIMLDGGDCIDMYGQGCFDVSGYVLVI